MKSTIFAILVLSVVLLSSSVSLAQTIGTIVASPNTTGTVPSTNTTVLPTNTTVLPTNTTVPPTNTTVPPTNTTVPAKKTTTPALTTKPTTVATTTEPSEPTFSVKDGNVTCIAMMADITFVITYERKTEKGTINDTASIALPRAVQTSGTCGNKTQTIKLSFFKDWTLQYDFTMNGKNYYASKITFNGAIDDHFPNATSPGKKVSMTYNSSESYLKAEQKGYYVCDAEQTLSDGGVDIEVKDFKYEAFNTGKTVNFSSGSASECSDDSSGNSIVPIAVGASLAGLVLIVLIGFLIGRKRTRKTGYESV